MGAVFALYSAWYFWVPKILGVLYNISWGKIHFWILFVGVNVTFFPQHFLGLQGMPRRISDYPDAFAGWNMVSSLGSIVSVIATWLFLYILYVQLVKGKGIHKYIWLIAQFYYDTLRGTMERSYSSLEWGLSSPPKPHAFESLPTQSSNFARILIFFNVVLKKLTLSKFIIGLAILLSVALIKYLYFGGDYILHSYQDFLILGIPSFILSSLVSVGLTEYLEMESWNFNMLQFLLKINKAPMGGSTEYTPAIYKADEPYPSINKTVSPSPESGGGESQSNPPADRQDAPKTTTGSDKGKGKATSTEDTPLSPTGSGKGKATATEIEEEQKSDSTNSNTWKWDLYGIGKPSGEGSSIYKYPRNLDSKGYTIKPWQKKEIVVGEEAAGKTLNVPEEEATGETLGKRKREDASEVESPKESQRARTFELAEELQPVEPRSLFLGRGEKVGREGFVPLDNGTERQVPSYGYGMPRKERPEWENTPRGEDYHGDPLRGNHGSGFRNDGRHFESFRRQWEIPDKRMLEMADNYGEASARWRHAKRYLTKRGCWTDLREHWYRGFQDERNRKHPNFWYNRSQFPDSDNSDVD